MINNPGALCSLGVLAVAAADDLRSRRVHNALLAGLAVISLAVVTYVAGIGGIQNGILGLITGFIFYLPLAWFGVIGGGDLKLLSVVGISVGPIGVLVIGVLALIWGVVLGVFQVVLHGQLNIFLMNMYQILRMQKVERKSLHKIPFAVSLFFAALTYWSTSGGHWA